MDQFVQLKDIDWLHLLVQPVYLGLFKFGHEISNKLLNPLQRHMGVQGGWIISLMV